MAEFDSHNWYLPQTIRVNALDDSTYETGAVSKQGELEAMSQLIILEHSVSSVDQDYGSPNLQFEFDGQKTFVHEVCLLVFVLVFVRLVLVSWLFGWLVGWLVGQLGSWLVGWLVGRSVG